MYFPFLSHNPSNKHDTIPETKQQTINPRLLHFKYISDSTLRP